MGVRTGKAGKRVITIDGPEFMGRFLQHVLPSGFKRIRHYGLLSPALKTERMASARAALNMPAASAPAREDAAEFLKRAAQIDATRCSAAPEKLSGSDAARAEAVAWLHRALSSARPAACAPAGRASSDTVEHQAVPVAVQFGGSSRGLAADA